MEKISQAEIKLVSGGFLPAVAVGIAIGTIVKSGYNKYQRRKAEEAAASRAAVEACLKNPNCI